MNDGLPVKEISAKAFYDCDTLISITLPDGITAIGNNAFEDCGKLASIVIPDSVTTIGDYAFSYCRSLTSVVIPDSVTTIGDSAFYYCSSLTSVVIPDSVTTIGDSAFYYCDNLTNVTIGNSVTTIGDDAFPEHLYKRYGGCYYLPTKNSEYGFLCAPIDNDITSVRIHYDCKSINRSAFSSCKNLMSVIISDSVTTIGDSAFA